MRYLVIGGGILGVAVAHRIATGRPGSRVTLVEKEPTLACHQTGRNSGVIHAGVYYPPGSLKARLCRAGSRSIVEFCRAHDLPVEVCGKLVVAVDSDEVPRLRALHDRAAANGLPVRLIEPAEAREHEPHLRCRAALHVASTGIVDFAAVTRTLAGLAAAAGTDIRLRTRVTGFAETAGETVVCTTAGEFPADLVVNCAGLHADRIARLAGVRPPARIVPFRGEYFALREDRRHLVRGLIYPVPDPGLPFLGVHLTRGVDGAVHAGPNAVLALAREGYSWRAVSPRDVGGLLAYPGLWRLARRHLRTGLAEARRSLSRRRFAADVARLVPEVTAADLRPMESGVRAQAVRPDGTLVDDFLLVTRPRQVHVLNAPSP
ncbi:MAG TPA: L-2-hydroxyglutarate oxidase, partial [Micromonosporaceae bacterium]|nr:L-2-hydroxyglutarate oxidase [Micromonosporaceae bacterium]